MHLYTDLADWFHLLTAPEEYAEEAAHYREVLGELCAGTASTLLELGCGGGNNASYLKRWFTCTLTDLSPAMLEQSRKLNPECEHVAGDMRTLRLGRTFDLVFVHDAVMYLTELADLRALADTLVAHLRPGGGALIVPDFVRETFTPGTGHGGHDGSDGRAIRYLEWTHDPDPSDTHFEVDMVYLLRAADGSVRIVHDPWREGLFSIEEWQTVLEQAGFAVRFRAAPGARQQLILCRRPSGA